MVAKFNRELIRSINSGISNYPAKSKAPKQSKSVAVPGKETFRHVLENAKKGNEMAAVLLEEWQRSCKPGNEKEKRIVSSINKAADKIFG